MMIKKGVLVTLIAAVLLASAPFAVAQHQHGFHFEHSVGATTISTAEIGVMVSANGEVPHFRWWNESDPGTDYHVMFSAFFEANDTDMDGAFTPGEDQHIGAVFSLPMADWEFSGFVTEEQNDVVTALHFNFTNTDTISHQGPGMMTTIPGMPGMPGHTSPMDIEIQIRVHFYLATPDQFKFDLRVSGWEWTYDDSILVFQFRVAESQHLHSQVGQVSEIAHEGNKFSFGYGWMEYTQNAFAGNATHQVQVRASHGPAMGTQDGNAIFIAFENFGNETLDYDPIIGFTQLGTTWTFFGIDYTQLLILAGGVSIVAVVVIAAKNRQ
ncbi:MAG: hypothetical protein AM324_004165 [Candidatus Thorarchaeota archaeon SMTZ1-83]|nr:MAG: hypothetical protein AM324_05280 [Candidatus Thorarchaeota archaeon SMTZ1-83]